MSTSTIERYFQAAKSGDAEDIERLLTVEGIEVNCLHPRQNRTALHIACCEGHQRVVEVLIHHGADPKMKNQCRVTALHDASWTGKSHIVRLILQSGRADPNIQDVCGKTALHDASFTGNVEVAQLLLEHKADACILNGSGNAPLHVAVLNEKVEIVRLLLEKYRLDPNIENRDGKTPLQILCERDTLVDAQTAILNMLLENGADNHFVVLSVACEHQNTTAIFLLIPHLIEYLIIPSSS